MVPVTDEAELKAMTAAMYRRGGVGNVLFCVETMAKCQQIILQKLVDLMTEEDRKRDL